MIVGDMNARTGDLNECNIVENNEHDFFNQNVIGVYGETDLPLKILDNDLLKYVFSLTRSNTDKTVNEYVHRLVNLSLMNGMIFVNGRKDADKFFGRTTFCGNRGESAYVLCCNSSMSLIYDFQINDSNVFSDHRSVEFKLELSIFVTRL